MNVYEIITERIIAQLAEGQIPWRKPWASCNSNGAYNYVSKKQYSLMNQMLLMHADAYLTAKQITTLGGKIKKGSKAEIVVFWKMLPIEEENSKGEKEKRLIPMLRYYNVFWIGDTDLENKDIRTVENDIDPDEQAEDIISAYVDREGITFINNMVSDEAYYMPGRDLVNVPKIEQFANASEYYSTVFHELTHSTGHEKRLNRLTKGKKAMFGKEDYSKEELVAELGASALVNYCGLETEESFKNNAGYIQSWIKALKNDTRMIVSAGSKAEKAVNYILTGEKGEKE